MKRLPDDDARRRIREDLDATFVVEAAAGTGKTTALVSRIGAVLRTGRTSLRRVVAVTFTEKAAGEMKLRLREEIERLRKDPGTTPAERSTLDGALEELEVARIGTIHALCADLLRERPVEAGVDPAFDVMTEDEARRIFDDAFEPWFQAALADPPEGVRRMLRRRPRGRDAIGPRDLLHDAAWKLVDHRDFDAPWLREAWDREAAIDAILGRVASLDSFRVRARNPDDWLAKGLDRARVWLDELRRVEAVRGRDYDGLEAELHEVQRWKEWGWLGRGPDFGDRLPIADVRAIREAVKAEIDGVVAAADADLAARLHEELRPVVLAYEAKKVRTGKLDFLDLLLRARDLVANDRGAREALQSSITHLFVDEFQDTDPLQADLLLLLAADDPAVSDPAAVRPVSGKLFVVGDPKQSIYRFRRADVALYERAKKQLAARGAEVLYLVTSFRSVPAIQSAVNAAFSAAMSREGRAGDGQADYVPLSDARDDVVTQPAIVALPAPRIYGDWGRPQVVKWKVEESLPAAVGAFVEWLLAKSGWTVTERSPGGGDPVRVRIEARHVCILLKRFKTFGQDVTHPYVRALEARRIPHVLVGGRSFHDREEVGAIKNALAAIEWPDDAMSVYATLRGPFFALHDDVLLGWRETVGSFHPFAKADPDALAPALREVAEAMTVLARLHRRRNRRPIADTIADLLETTRAHAGLANWPSGEQVLANVLRMMDLARRFEAGVATSFRAFVGRLDEDAARGEANEAPVVEEGTEGVRVMTVHRAKGLEFPVVILAEPTAPPAFEKPSRHVVPEKRLWLEPLAGMVPTGLALAHTEAKARDDEEAVRVAYVAATRARDLLVVPVVGDEDIEGWTAVLNPAVYPELATKRRSKPGPGCPKFGDDSVLERPSEVRGRASTSVAPGLHVPRAGTHGVVWWDPKILELDAEQDVGLRQQEILMADDGGAATDEGTRRHEAWQLRRRETLAKGAVPSRIVWTVTELAEVGADADVVVEETSAVRTKRPHGKRFGTLVHAVLAAVALGSDEASVRRAASLQGRLLGATDEEVAAAAASAIAALAHPVLARAAASADVRRETSVALRLDDGAIVEGIVDLAFQDDGGWTVVDFKTDVELGDRRAEYARQVALYVSAVAAATGEPARGLLLCV